MPEYLVLVVLIFVAAGLVLLAGPLVAGLFVRPHRPSPEKAEVYECGEQPIGSAWVQFDLRFYVVALLFVIFDVEMAFFFPWAVVFGRANELADPNLPVERRVELTRQMPTTYEAEAARERSLAALSDTGRPGSEAVTANVASASRLAW